MKHNYLLVGLLVLVVMLVLAGCGGSASGKALAEEAIAAFRAEDHTKLEEIGHKFDELPPVQKVRFGTELAKHGDELQTLVEEIVGASLGQ